MIDLPLLGFGTYQDNVDRTYDVVMSALKAGYRHLDTAAVYRNERQVGHAIRDFLHQNQSMSRDQLFVTGKLPPNGMNPSRVEHFLRRTLQLLDLQYLDLYLIHAPFAVKYHTDETFFPVNSDTNTLDADLTALEDTWKGLESMVDQGLTRRIGLSNFNSKQIDRIIDCAVIRPFANQIECNVFFQNRTLIRHCRSNHIRPIAFAPLGSPRRQKSHSRSFVQDASQQLSSSSTNAQLMLAFLAQQEISAVVGADNEIQVQQNWQSQQVKLSKFQVQQLEQLDSNQRTFYFEYANGIRQHPEYPFID